MSAHDRLYQWSLDNPRGYRLGTMVVLGTCAASQVWILSDPEPWWWVNLAVLVFVLATIALDLWVWTRQDQLDELRRLVDQQADRPVLKYAAWLYGYRHVGIRETREINQWLVRHDLFATPVDDMPQSVRRLRSALALDERS